MKALDVVFGLHFYQPPTQLPEVLDNITRKCYRPLLETISQEITCRCCRFTVDVAGSLILQLNQHSPDVLESFKNLIDRNRIHLVNTAAYHPILPLVPSKFAERQLILNRDIYRSHGFLPSWGWCPGVFPPEMAVSPQLFETLRVRGYRWTITDDPPFTALSDPIVPVDRIPVSGGMPCFLRSELWSKRISFDIPMPDGAVFAHQLWEEFSAHCRDRGRAYLVIWMDAETFGHHRPEAFERFLIPFLRTIRNMPMIRMKSPQELLTLYPEQDVVVPAGSWATSKEQALENIPYPLWQHPKNDWHAKWWELAGLVLEIADAHTEVQQLSESALYSCQTWWVGLYNDKTLFHWAIPDFEEILKAGTAEQQEKGKKLIEQLKR